MLVPLVAFIGFVPTLCIVTLVAFVWLFLTVYFQMAPQITWLKRCIVTLVAFFLLLFPRLFSFVFSICLFEKMHRHSNCSCKIVMLAEFFLHLFPFLLQMNPQICLLYCVEIFFGKKPKKINGKVCLVYSQFLVTDTYKFPLCQPL